MDSQRKMIGNLSVNENKENENGKSIVLVNDVRYKSRRSIEWNEIETYLKQYVGECFEILETSDKVYIGTDFPDEFAYSKCCGQVFL